MLYAELRSRFYCLCRASVVHWLALGTARFATCFRHEAELEILMTRALIVAILIATPLAACGASVEQKAATGAVAGAVVAGPVGAAVGGAAGTAVGQAQKPR
jgi:osmotically inducible lipoprotein OsmB